MFTGIIEETGTIKYIEKAAQGAVISVACTKILNDLKIGDSVAVNGACQTVVKLKSDGFDVEASQETISLTNFGNLQPGSKVNLERAMSANGRFGGHIVTGHIDGIGKFEKKVYQGLADLYYFYAPDEVAKYLVYKGSICINGISLTIALLEGNIFSVSVIPLTSKETNLSDLQPGDSINLESDILAKYIEKFVSKNNNTNKDITLNYLEEHGFVG